MWAWVQAHAQAVFVITQILSVVLLFLMNGVLLWGWIRMSRTQRRHADETRDGFQKLSARVK